MWFYNGQLFDTVLSEFDSFVYLIERLNIEEDPDSPRYYIGKKTFYNKSKYQGKRIIVESDWWDYYGSSEWLCEDVERYGKSNFKRTILHLCRTKGDSGYLEAKEQIERNVLHIDEKGLKLYYNKNVLGNYRNEPELYVLEDNLESYYALDQTQGTKKWVNNGKTNRLVTASIARNLVEKSDWNYGMCEKHIMVGGKEIPKSQYNPEVHDLGYKETIQVKTGKKTKISILKDNKQKWITSNELSTYLEDGWVRHINDSGIKYFSVTDEVNQRHFYNEEEKNHFLNNNPNWRDGKPNTNNKDSVFARDMRTDEKVLVSSDELENNPFLTSINTKKVKIKKKNRIIFKGYLDFFILENPEYPKSTLLTALKSDSGDVLVKKGMNTWINDEKINIRWL